MCLQKNENPLLAKKKNQLKAADGAEIEDGEGQEQYDTGEIDAYGNKVEVQEDEENKNEASYDEEKDSDAQKVKENLRNSSKIYYKITHSIQEEINE